MAGIFKTDGGYAALVLRLALGAVFFAHGAQKMLGWYGGYGFSGTMGFFTTQGGLPWIAAFLVICGEFFGSLGLITGLLSRIAAGGIALIMAGAVFIHWPNGFFMNWFGKQKGEGFEFHLLAIAIAVALMILGSGALSLDRLVHKKLTS